MVEGERVARAGASRDVLDMMTRQLGIGRETVAADLRRALEDFLRRRLGKVSVMDPVEDSTKPLLFFARYIYRDDDNVSAGVVWYDVTASTTGPEGLSPLIRNKMRLEVHRQLTSDGSSARALVDLHK
jgi:hypothetical protein